jgi:hypothetical protein
MDKQETNNYWCWRMGQPPSNATAIGPESAARDYAARKLGGKLHEQAPVGGKRAQSMDVIVASADGSGVFTFEVTAELTSRRLGGE